MSPVPTPRPSRCRALAARLAALALVLSLVGAPGLVRPHPAHAASKTAMEESLRQREEQARETREALTRLTQQERDLHGDLAEVEDDLDALRRKVRKQENTLDRLDAELKQARAAHRRLEAEQQRSWKELGRLIQALWPLRVATHRGRTQGHDSWAEADRRFTWGAALYADARRAQQDIERRSRDIAASIERQQELRARTEQQLAAVNRDKDGLLGKRLDFVRDIRKVRAERINEEQALSQVLSAVKDMEYRLKALDAKSFKQIKGALPRPVQGKKAPAARGRDGMGFATAERAPVTAVYWGRVVHNDILRGYGRVVILYHGDDYYSLYAFLDGSPVSIGQEMEKGEPIGTAGYYPQAKGPGLYFELRLGQKAINPVHWFASRN